MDHREAKGRADRLMLRFGIAWERHDGSPAAFDRLAEVVDDLRDEAQPVIVEVVRRACRREVVV